VSDFLSTGWEEESKEELREVLRVAWMEELKGVRMMEAW
jgi:hypothetical protein